MYYPALRTTRVKEVNRMQKEAGKFIPNPWSPRDLRTMPSKETYGVYKYTRLRYENYLTWLTKRKKQSKAQLDFFDKLAL